MTTRSMFQGNPYGYTLGDSFGSTSMIPEQNAFTADGGNEYPTTNTFVRRTVEIEHPVSESYPDDDKVALVNPHLGWKVGHLMFCRTTMNNEYEHATLIQLNEWMANKAKAYYSQNDFENKDVYTQGGLLYGLFFKFRPFGILIAYRTIGGSATLFNTNSQVINCGLVHSLIKMQNYAGQNMGPNLRLILIGRFVKLATGETMHFESKTEIGQYTSITNNHKYDMYIPQFYVHVNHSKHAPLNVEGGLPTHLFTEFESTGNDTTTKQILYVPTVRAYIGCVYPNVSTPFDNYDTIARVEGDLDDPVRKNSVCQSWGQNSVNIEFTKTYNISITDDENTEKNLTAMMKLYPCTDDNNTKTVVQQSSTNPSSLQVQIQTNPQPDAQPFTLRKAASDTASNVFSSLITLVTGDPEETPMNDSSKTPLVNDSSKTTSLVHGTPAFYNNQQQSYKDDFDATLLPARRVRGNIKPAGRTPAPNPEVVQKSEAVQQTEAGNQQQNNPEAGNQQSEAGNQEVIQQTAVEE
jgi:hypothetical protein